MVVQTFTVRLLRLSGHHHSHIVMWIAPDAVPSKDLTIKFLDVEARDVAGVTRSERAQPSISTTTNIVTSIRIMTFTKTATTKNTTSNLLTGSCSV